MTDQNQTTDREALLRGAHIQTWNDCLDAAEMAIRSCPSLDENGYIVELRNVITMLHGLRKENVTND